MSPRTHLLLLTSTPTHTSRLLLWAAPDSHFSLPGTIEDHLKACVMWAGIGALETPAAEKRGESSMDLCVYRF